MSNKLIFTILIIIKATGMQGTTEVIIRLLMAEFIKEACFAPHFREFLEVTHPPKNLEIKIA